MLVLPFLLRLYKLTTAAADMNGWTFVPEDYLSNPVSQVYIPGDVVIGGLVPVHLKGNVTPCGEMMEGRGMHRVMAQIFAINYINSVDDWLPGIRLGTRILDTCSQQNYALNMSLLLIDNLLMESQAHRYVCPNNRKFPPQIRIMPQPLAGVVGASYSTVTTMVANLLRLYRIVLVSPASTNPDLSDKSKYDFFARTVPSDAYQAKVLADVARHFNWTYVSLIYSEGEYGRMGADRFIEATASRNICVAYEGKTSDSANWTEIVLKLKEKAKLDKPGEVGARAVILFTRNVDTRRLLAEAKVYHIEGLQWLAAEGWETTNQQMLTDIEDVANGALVIALASSELPGFEHFLKTFDPRTSLIQSDWFIEWWEVKFRCSMRQSTLYTTYGRPCTSADTLGAEATLLIDDKVEFVIDAVFAIAHALHKYWKDKCHGVPGLCEEMLSEGHSALFNGHEFYYEYLLKVSFTGITGTNFHFTKEGDGPPNYVIKNYRAVGNNYSVVGVWNNSRLTMFEEEIVWNSGEELLSRCALECKEGERKAMLGDSTCCWLCTSCKRNGFLIDEFNCGTCPRGMWPSTAKRECYKISDRHLQVMEWGSIYSVIPCAMAAIGILFTSIVVRVLIVYSDTPIVKASGRELSYALLSGIFICYLMTFVILIPPTFFVCTVRRLGIGLGFAMLYAALLVKTNRIFRIFNSARHSAQRPKYISPQSQLIITGILVLFQLIGSVIWLIVSPPGVTIEYPEPQPQAVPQCRTDNRWFLFSLAYDMVLILTCTVYAVKTRMVPENFNEAKFIGFTMYTTCVIWLAFVPIYFGTGNDFRIQTTTLCVSISLSATVALICLYSPKLYVIFLEPEKNVRKPAGTGVPGFTTNSSQASVYSPLLGRQLTVNKSGPFSATLNDTVTKEIGPAGRNSLDASDLLTPTPTPPRRISDITCSIEQSKSHDEIGRKPKKSDESLTSM